MKKFDYYTAPPQKIFEDIKKCAIEIWKTYDNNYGYVDEKVGRIKDLKNISDNAWTIVAMFDSTNQAKLLMVVKKETAQMVLKAIRGY
jgi:hypothetical protein